jgi:hypothetical protein
MTLEKVLYTAKACTTGSWKDIFIKQSLLRLVFVTLLAAQAAPNRERVAFIAFGNLRSFTRYGCTPLFQ